ncbi:hypothetical protein Cadr_000030983 [Camelus dromedarius]|uniref:Uncharacterized protein n=1 Tax=Camelus dromedarius TaxID=9838 RepID=A0A5N4C0I1_CAMDR|nr:hypothetical protein Cadr_000030983 [Camelus dromedarius]
MLAKTYRWLQNQEIIIPKGRVLVRVDEVGDVTFHEPVRLLLCSPAASDGFLEPNITVKGYGWDTSFGLVQAVHFIDVSVKEGPRFVIDLPENTLGTSGLPNSDTKLFTLNLFSGDSALL